MNIRVHIEQLILEGLPANGLHSGLIGQTVEAELTRLLSAEGMMAAVSRHEAHVPIAHLALVRPNDTIALGSQIGGVLFQVLNPASQNRTIPGRAPSPISREKPVAPVTEKI
jgi:hypothetical protein